MNIARATSPRSDEDGLRVLRELVQDATGIQLGPQKDAMVRGRLGSRFRALGLDAVGDYVRFLQKHPEEFTALIDLLSTNKTSFFREPRHFTVLTDHLRALPPQREPVRIWSAGCSSGEEAYTMAVTTAAAGVDARILATDISSRVLATGKAARYPREELEGVPADAVDRLFVRGAGELRVQPAHVAKVSFAGLNLLGPWPMKGPFQAIFCRNVMIYFDKPTRERLVARFREKLAPGGLLFVGLSESLTGLEHDYEALSPGVYRR